MNEEQDRGDMDREVNGLKARLVDTEKQLSRIRASIGAIHWHSGKFSSRYWMLVPAGNLGATLKAIHEECEFAVPDIKKFCSMEKI